MRWSSLMVILFIQLGWSCWESVLNPSWVWNTDEIISINFPWHPKFAQFVCEQYPSVYLYVINFFFPAPPTWYIDACRSRCESPWFDAPQSPSIRHFSRRRCMTPCDNEIWCRRWNCAQWARRRSESVEGGVQMSSGCFQGPVGWIFNHYL